MVLPNANEPVRSPLEKTQNEIVYAELDLEHDRTVSQRASEPVRVASRKNPSQTVNAELGPVPREKPQGRVEGLSESEYANSLQANSVYANSAHTRL